MGLDMYAYCTETAIADVDFDTSDDAVEIATWRKHPNLHGWMEQLYRAKGGKQSSFNCAPVRLDPADLDALEAAVLGDDLPHTTGFFFGISEADDREDDLAFIRSAREAIDNGDAVFYDSWW